MSIQWVLDPTYNFIKNSKLNQALEVTSSLKAPIHYVEDLTIQKNEAGNMVFDAPVVECVILQSDAVNSESVFTDNLNPLTTDGNITVNTNLNFNNINNLLNVNSLTVASGAGAENQVLSLDADLNLVWKNDVAGDVSQWSTYNAVSDVNLGSNNLNGSKCIMDDVWSNYISLPKNGSGSSIELNSFTNTGKIPTLKVDNLDTVLPESTQINVNKNLNLGSNILYCGTLNTGINIVSGTFQMGVEPNPYTGADDYVMKQIDGVNVVTSDSHANLTGFSEIQSYRGKFYTTDADLNEKFSADSTGAIVSESISTKNIIIPDSTPTNGQVLKTADGAIYWANDTNTPADWSQYPAQQTVDMNSNSLSNVQGITMTGALNCNQINPLEGFTEVSITSDLNMVNHRLDVGDIYCTKVLPTYKVQYDYFVSKNGNNSTANGSIENPFQTIQACVNTCDALTAVDNLYRYVHVLGGDYSTETVTLTKKIFLIGEGLSADSSSVGCQVQSIVLNLDSNGNDIFNNQVVIKGFLVKSIVDTASTANHVLNIVNSYIYANDRAVYVNPSCTDCRLWFSGCNVVSSNTSSTNPLVEMTKGMMKANLTLFNSKGIQSTIQFSGTSRVDSVTLCQIIADGISATMPPIVNITSSTSSAFTFANSSFVYSNATSKTASPSSCGIYCNSSSTSTTVLITYNVFALAGTNGSNFVINHGAIPCVTLFFSNSATLGNASSINGNNNTTKFSLSAVA